MPSTVEQLSPTRVKLTVELSFADLKPSLDKAYAEIAKQVAIPGFRKGKVPAALIDQRYGRGVVLQEAINDALPGAYAHAVQELNIIPLGQPEIEVTRLEDGNLVEFVAQVDVRPEFDLPDFGSITTQVDALEVPDAAVDERIELLRQRFAETTEVDRAAAEGDVVVLDLEGSQDAEVLEDATASGISYKIGSGGMLEGLDEAVTGLKAGESATFTSSLLGGSHRGESTDIKVTVQKVSEQVLPEVNDEFAQLVSEFDTVEEMRADLRESMLRQARLDQAGQARDRVLEAAIAQTEFELPESLVESEVDARKEQVTNQLQQAGLTLEQYLEQNEEEADSEEAFWDDLTTRSRDALRAQIVLDRFADENAVGVEQSELTELILRRAQQAGTTPDQEVKHMMDHNHMGEWMQEIRRSKALGAIVNAATITDSNNETLRLDQLRADGTVAGADDPAPMQGGAGGDDDASIETDETEVDDDVWIDEQSDDEDIEDDQTPKDDEDETFAD